MTTKKILYYSATPVLLCVFNFQNNVNLNDDKNI